MVAQFGKTLHIRSVFFAKDIFASDSYVSLS